MTRPHSVCWIVAATAMVVLLSPSPAGVSAVSEPGFAAPDPVGVPCSDPFDRAGGPWLVGRLLVPYPVEIAPPRLAAFAQEPPRATPHDPALGPWDVAGMLAPYPVGIASHLFGAFAPRPVTPPGAAAEGCGLGPWPVEQLLAPYPQTLPLEQLARLAVMPQAQLFRGAPAPPGSRLGPWRVEQFACPYGITAAPEPDDEPAAQAALARPAPTTREPAPPHAASMGTDAPPTHAPPTAAQPALPCPAPTAIDSPLGPWHLERLLVPYPASVAAQRLPEYTGPLTVPWWPNAAEVRPHERLMMRVTGATRRLLGLLEHGTQAARRALKNLRPPVTPALRSPRVLPRRGPDLDMSTQAIDAREGLQKLIETLDEFAPRPASRPDDVRADFILPWREAPQTASDPFALEQRWTDVDAEPNVAAPALRPAEDPLRPPHVAGLERFFPPSTGIAFLAALLLVPASCSYAAGAVYGYARDGPT